MKYMVSNKTGLELVLDYFPDGTIAGFKASRPMGPEEWERVKMRLNYSQSTMKDLQKTYPQFVRPLPDQVDFESFWEKYNHKVDRKRAKDKWDRLGEQDQAAAIAYLGKYEAELRQTGVAKMYAKTYLQNKIWK